LKEHAPAAHVGLALATLVVQTLPQPPQLFGSAPMSVHVPPLQGTGAFVGHIELHE
jgi:hypothetical protein